MNQIAEYSETEAALAILASKYKRTYDVKTSEGMGEARLARADIRRYRTKLEATRKELKAPALERCKAIDGEAERIENALLELESPINDQIKSEEARREEEKERAALEVAAKIEAARKVAAELRGSVGQMIGQPSVVIGNYLAKIRATVILVDPIWADAAAAQKEALEHVTNLYSATLEREAEDKRRAEDRAELERLRMEADRQEREKRGKLEADAKAERERIAKESAAADAERVKLDKAAADARAKAEADAKAERERQDKQAAASRAQEDARIAAERAKLAAEKAKAEADAAAAKAAADAKAKAASDQAAAQATAAEAERLRSLDAWKLLSEFVKRFGELPEFAEVVAAIKGIKKPK